MGNFEPNMSDVEAMLRFHGFNNGNNVNQDSQENDIDPLTLLNLPELRQMYDPNSAQQLMDDSISKPADSIQSSAQKIQVRSQQ